MNRIVTALLIVIGVLVFNGGLLRQAFAESAAVRAPASVEVKQPLVIRSGRVLVLLMTLEALRFADTPANPSKG